MIYSRDPLYCQAARKELLALEDYFCGRAWLARALCQHHLAVEQWLTTTRVPSPYGREKIQRLFALIKDIVPLAPNQAQLGWWLVCRHFRTGSYPGSDLYYRLGGHADIVALARDDFCDGSRLHRLDAPSFTGIPAQRWPQVNDRPWYLLNLPNRPPLADKRLEHSPAEIPSTALGELLG